MQICLANEVFCKWHRHELPPRQDRTEWNSICPQANATVHLISREPSVYFRLLLSFSSSCSSLRKPTTDAACRNGTELFSLDKIFLEEIQKNIEELNFLLHHQMQTCRCSQPWFAIIIGIKIRH